MMQVTATAATRKRQNEDEQRIVRLLDSAQRDIRRRFKEAIIAIQNAADLATIADLLEQGRVGEALDIAEAASSAAFAALASTVDDWFVLGGKDAALGLSTALDTVVAFNRVDPAAVESMRQAHLRLIQGLTEDAREAARTALSSGITRGINPRAMAREFRDSLGLTPFQERAVQNYRRLLEQGSADALDRALRDRRFDRTVARAADEPLSQAQIDKMVARYRERYLKYRAEVIARTEALRAVHEGQEVALTQAVAAGHVEAAALERTWVATFDSRTRDSHAAMDGQKRKLGEPFVSGDGWQLRYPGDINAPISETAQCRCALTTRIVKQPQAAA